MTTTKLLSCLLIACLFAACSPKNDGVLTEAQKQTLDKSKKTEDVLDKANKERMKAADEAEKQP